jgi:hypothetical protein
MLVTFRTKAHADITMFGDVAIELLKLAGLSGNVPSAILAADIPPTLARLESGLAHRRSSPDAPELRTSLAPGRAAGTDPDAEPAIPLDRRALPLIALLRDAAEAGTDVMIEGR